MFQSLERLFRFSTGQTTRNQDSVSRRELCSINFRQLGLSTSSRQDCLLNRRIWSTWKISCSVGCRGECTGCMRDAKKNEQKEKNTRPRVWMLTDALCNLYDIFSPLFLPRLFTRSIQMLVSFLIGCDLIAEYSDKIDVLLLPSHNWSKSMQYNWRQFSRRQHCKCRTWHFFSREKGLVWLKTIFQIWFLSIIIRSQKVFYFFELVSWKFLSNKIVFVEKPVCMSHPLVVEKTEFASIVSTNPVCL